MATIYYWYDSSNTRLHLSQTQIDSNYIQTTDYQKEWLTHEGVKENCIRIDLDTDIFLDTCQGLFQGMYSLQLFTQLNGHFNTDNVTDMSYMFYGCTNLYDFPVLWVTNRVTNMSYMFYGCKQGSGPPDTYTRWDTSGVLYMIGMFQRAGKQYQTLIRNLNTSNVVDMSSMFKLYGDYWVPTVTLDLTNFDTSNVTNMSHMFSNAYIKKVNLTSFDTSNVTQMSYMFSGCNNLQELDLSVFNTSNVTNMRTMFNGCNNLQELDLSNFNTSNVTSMEAMFYGCSGLQELDLSNFDTSNVTNMSFMFNSCNSMIELNLSNFNTSNVTDMAYMFELCRSLTELNLSSFDTSEVTNMYSMFRGCQALVILDLSNFDVNRVTNTGFMFYSDSNLKTIYCEDDWSQYLISEFSNMFTNCQNLVGAIRYDSTKTDINYANPTTGYFSRIPVPELYFNNTEIDTVYFNDTPITKIYFNDTLVFDKGGT